MTAVDGAYRRPGYLSSDPQQFNLAEWDVPLTGGLRYGKHTMYVSGRVMKPPNFSVQFAVTNGAFLNAFFGADTYSDPTHTLALKTTGFSTPSIFDVIFYALSGGMTTYRYQAVGAICPRIMLSISNTQRYLLASMDWLCQGMVVPLGDTTLANVTGAGSPMQFGTSASDVLTWGSTDLTDMIDSVDVVMAKEYSALTPVASKYVTDMSVFNPLCTIALRAKSNSSLSTLVTDILAGTARTLTFTVARSATDYIKLTMTSALLSKWDFGVGRGADEVYVVQTDNFAVETKDAVGDYDSAFAIS